MIDVPKKEVIDDIYKADTPKGGKRLNSGEINNKKNKNIDEDEEEEKDKKENDEDKNNEELNTSKLNESHLRRRQGIYNIYPISKKQEQKESKK